MPLLEFLLAYVCTQHHAIGGYISPSSGSRCACQLPSECIQLLGEFAQWCVSLVHVLVEHPDSLDEDPNGRNRQGEVRFLIWVRFCWSILVWHAIDVL
jgi:hypothetical protein